MALPTIPYQHVSTLARLVARLTEFVIYSRRRDESYGKEERPGSRVTLSLAVLQTYAANGLPMDSPRLRGIDEWLRSRSAESPGILLPPLRLLASATLRRQEDAIEDEISGTLATLRTAHRNGSVTKPILLMMSLEGLATTSSTSAECKEFKSALQSLPTILNSGTARPSVRAYAASLMFEYGGPAMESEAISGLEKIAELRRDGGWEDCLVETAYVILNMHAVNNRSAAVESAVKEGLEFLRRHCPKGIPDLQKIRRYPDELSRPEDLRTYAAAVVARALLGGMGSPVHARLEYAHAAWQLQTEKLEKKLRVLRWAVAGLTSIQAGLFAWLVFINQGLIERSISIAGSAASILPLAILAARKLQKWNE